MRARVRGAVSRATGGAGARDSDRAQACRRAGCSNPCAADSLAALPPSCLPCFLLRELGSSFRPTFLGQDVLKGQGSSELLKGSFVVS